MSCVLDMCSCEGGIAIEVLHIELSTLDELEGEVETGLASINGIDLCKEVVEGHRVVEFAIEWNGGWLAEEILDDSSAGSSSLSLEILNTSATCIAVLFQS